MGNRFEQDAADTLQWYRERAAADWKRSKDGDKISTTWAPTMTEQEKQEQEKYIKDNSLPF